MVQPVAVITGVAVGTRSKAAELADGQLLPAAATDEACRLSLFIITSSHDIHLSFFIFHL